MNFVYDDELKVIDHKNRRSLGGFYDSMRKVTVLDVVGYYDGDLYESWRGLLIRFDGIEQKDVVIHYRLQSNTNGKYMVSVYRGHQFISADNRQLLKDIVTDAIKAKKSLGRDEESKKLIVGRNDISWMTFEYKGWGDEIISAVNAKDDRHSITILDIIIRNLIIAGLLACIAYWKYKTLYP
jgi:hypothetical protein